MGEAKWQAAQCWNERRVNLIDKHRWCLNLTTFRSYLTTCCSLLRLALAPVFPRESLSPLSFSLSLFCSPHPLSVPLNSPFLLSPSNSPHLSAPCPGFSIHFSLSRPAFKTPAGFLLFPRDPNSVSLAVTSENQALVFSLPLCPLPPFFFSKRHDCIFNLGRLSFPPP